ncbi:FecCD family ABC transporter permease [Nocardiopsis lambiniae]|uniref:Iron ABC transporter permease n=1 Tax=Nocardiopsis lambiniae TaxID=3075539 RepID=A0ABU2MF66_9ACTN|nr:iron ABC transporter permease [Nocardiopsis sp. DSM 44743]MDT0331209.1 iron ABC transporter permease [Nocardiopsis sp. DSM 44743]
MSTRSPRRAGPSAPALASRRRADRDRRGFTAAFAVLALALALVAVVLASTATGAVDLSPMDAARLLLGHLVPGMPWMSDGTYTVLQDQAVWGFRLPRALLAALAGASLALAGALMQAVVHNPLAEPYVLGVSSGAGVGAVLVVVGGAVGGLSLSTAAFAGAATATAAVYLLARRNGRIAPQRLILAGVALGALFSAITSYLTLTTEAQNVFSVMFFLLGSVSAATMDSLLAPALALLVALVVVGANVRGINALLVGDEAAASLGVSVDRLRTVLLLVSALLVGAVVSVSGSIGFVGLIIPHIARILVGTDHRIMLPVSVLGGAVFLTAADLMARTVAAPVEIPIGILTAVIGAPFFLWLLRRDRASTVGMDR